ncbi:hypothetical protein Tsubulata_032316 [Turnera subulata]|uniref:Zinc knuckle CX2CX4HX4C domain-containing protein n=1 Tax=Turnera subulata TaxID=218843 RepID=A0A9Q0JDU1_9ROSI|nr:hypothetical protein Tsubulata_032316 [Turnera subulata]
MGGLFVEYNGLEKTIENMYRWLGFIRMKVQVKVDSPLLSGIMVKDLVGNKVWIRFKYEKLTDFCYRCGRLEHTVQACKNRIREDERIEKQTSNSFGPWMKATLMVGKEIPGGKIKRAAVYEEELVKNADLEGAAIVGDAAEENNHADDPQLTTDISPNLPPKPTSNRASWKRLARFTQSIYRPSEEDLQTRREFLASAQKFVELMEAEAMVQEEEKAGVPKPSNEAPI